MYALFSKPKKRQINEKQIKNNCKHAEAWIMSTEYKIVG